MALHCLLVLLTVHKATQKYSVNILSIVKLVVPTFSLERLGWIFLVILSITQDSQFNISVEQWQYIVCPFTRTIRLRNWKDEKRFQEIFSI